jgi:hypothetical protein
MKKFVAYVAILYFCAMLISCNIASVVAYVTTPDPEQEAMYVLPDVTTVVFVDDRRDVLHPVRLRRVIAEQVTNELLAKKILTTMISPRDVMRVSATNDKYNNLLSVGELGSAVNAGIVIYVEMTAFGLTSDGHTANPRASCNIRVVDVENNRRLFPEGNIPYSVSDTISHVSSNRVTSSTETRELSEELAMKLGDSIAKVFYDHKVGRLGENLKRK